MVFPAGNILIPFDECPAIDKEKICVFRLLFQIGFFIMLAMGECDAAIPAVPASAARDSFLGCTDHS